MLCYGYQNAINISMYYIWRILHLLCMCVVCNENLIFYRWFQFLIYIKWKSAAIWHIYKMVFEAICRFLSFVYPTMRLALSHAVVVVVSIPHLKSPWRRFVSAIINANNGAIANNETNFRRMAVRDPASDTGREFCIANRIYTRNAPRDILISMGGKWRYLICE